jgi:glycosyltransferase involved in cell wall biosynthesis
MPPTRRHRKRTTRKLPKSAAGVQWPRGSIVYLCGNTALTFSPDDNDLGGSEQAVVQLSKCWASKGHPVVVYGNVKETIRDGVEYRSIHRLNLADTFDTVIFWRSFGIRLLPLVQARFRMIDLHDSWDPKNYVAPSQLIELADAVMVKSKYHKSLYPYIPSSKMHIVMNGVQIDLFNTAIKSIPESKRDPYRLIYASTYERGLEPILRYSWPKIKAAIPEASIDIYYGLNRLAKTPLGIRLKKLFKQPGVNEHGRIPLSQIAKEKATSAIHMYISNSPTEIDCISVRESLLCGAVPVLGNDYVFKEREGVHVSGSTSNPNTYKKAGSTVIHLLKHQDALEKKRNELRKSDTIISWETVAERWLKIMKN